MCDLAGPFPLLFENGGYRLVRCAGCGLVFQDPQPDAAVLAESYYHDPAFAKALLGPLRSTTLERAREKLPLLRRAGVGLTGSRVLDVGCSSGAFVELAGSEGAHVTGVEVGEPAAAGARARGLDVRTGTLEQVLPELSGERFDLITFWDVLEHLRDPRHELALAARLLARGGTVAATFPNIEGLFPRVTYRVLARSTGIWEHPELPVHLYDLGPSSARALLGRCGYRSAALTTTGTPFAFFRENSLSPARTGTGPRGRAVRLAFEALYAVLYPLARLCDRGNAIFVAARR